MSIFVTGFTLGRAILPKSRNHNLRADTVSGSDSRTTEKERMSRAPADATLDESVQKTPDKGTEGAVDTVPLPDDDLVGPRPPEGVGEVEGG